MSKSSFTRRSFLQTMGAAAASFAMPSALSANWATEQAGAQGAGAKKPNIVFILVDDLGWTDAACFGSKYYDTPHIDRLASGGMKFTNAYAACAVCSPTRAAVLTGRYPVRTRVTDWLRNSQQGLKIPADKKNPTGFVGGKDKKLLTPTLPIWMEHEEVTIAEMLKEAGYATCHVGKWHLGPGEWLPDGQGFDENIGGWDFGQPPSYFDPYANRNVKSIPTLPPRKEGEYLTDREADEAAGFIKRNQDQPFFLYLANYAVHAPIQGKPELIEKYKKRTPTNQDNPAYAAMVESVDQAVGKVTGALDELGLSDNTIVIYTSDNGGATHFPATDNAPLRKGKGFPYEGGIRVPAIVRWPGEVEPGSVCHEPMCSVDFLPTLGAAVGAKPSGRVIDGVDLAPALRQTGSLNREALYWHFPHYWWGTNVRPYSIVRAGDWKLIKHYEDSAIELYNLKEDISEKVELSKQHPAKVKELEKMLTAWLKETGAKLPKPNPDYDRR